MEGASYHSLTPTDSAEQAEELPACAHMGASGEGYSLMRRLRGDWRILNILPVLPMQ